MIALLLTSYPLPSHDPWTRTDLWSGPTLSAYWLLLLPLPLLLALLPALLGRHKRRYRLALSSFALVLIAALWGRSYLMQDRLNYMSGYYIGLSSVAGKSFFHWSDAYPPGRAWLSWMRRPRAGADDTQPSGPVALGAWRHLGFAYVHEYHPGLGRMMIDAAVPYWFWALAPVLLLVRDWRKRRRPRPGLCPSCGYDLRATPDRCPECGHDMIPITPADGSRSSSDRENAVGAE